MTTEILKRITGGKLMRFCYWFKPGIKIKRWIILSIIGVACISSGLSFLVEMFRVKEIYWSFMQIAIFILLILSGCILIVLSIKFVSKPFINAISNNGFRISLDSEKLNSMLYDKRIHINGRSEERRVGKEC